MYLYPSSCNLCCILRLRVLGLTLHALHLSLRLVLMCSYEYSITIEDLPETREDWAM